jgi:hypothetical protein
MYLWKFQLLLAAVAVVSAAVALTVVSLGTTGNAVAGPGQRFVAWPGNTVSFHELDWSCKFPGAQPKIVVCRRTGGPSIGITLTPNDLRVFQFDRRATTLLYKRSRNP